MLNEKKLMESSKIIKQCIEDNQISKPIKGTTNFFFEKSMESIIIAENLIKLEKENKVKSSIWIINTSYYSMFFVATALLAFHGHKIKSETGIHRLTFHALVHYFVNEDDKIKKHFIEQYANAANEAEELM